MQNLFHSCRGLAVLVLATAAGLPALRAAEEPAVPAPRDLLCRSARVVFLGDSITASGQYVAHLEAWLLTQRLPQSPHIIDAGLPSETVSGLSEDGHAGGKFPRPDLAERLDRVLAVTKPELVFACYGINCGIYQPFDESRFARYQAGIRHLKAQVEKAGARLVLITPPSHDDARAKLSFSYNEVLDRYREWLLAQRAAGWIVVDLHGPMARELVRRRRTDPEFTFQPDGVHPNADGQWFVAQQLIRWVGDEPSAAAASPTEMLQLHQIPKDVLPLLQQKVAILRDAYVGTAGHKRPGVAVGLPIAEAEQKAEELSRRIHSLSEVRP